MDEATTRRRAPSPSNTRKFVEADARSTDLLPKSSRSHARRPSTNFLQVRDEPEFILHDLAGPYPVQNSPSTPGSAAHPVQNSPSKRPWQAHPVQNSPSEPQNADFGPPFACRENYLPLPPPTRRARRKKSRTNTPLLASCLDRHTSPGQSTVYALYLVTFRREHQSTRGADIPMTVLQHGFVRRKIPITACAKVISGPTYHRRVSHRFESAYADRL